MNTHAGNDFNIRFVELCGREQCLYDPTLSGEIEAAAGRVSRALQQRGFSFGPEKVKPMFDRVRALYEEELQNRAEGRCSELKWFQSMDVYMRPFVRPGTEGASSCSNDDAPALEKVAEGIECEDDTPCDVCGSALPEDGNEMIFCDKCNVCVHQACYGVPVIPESDWYCRPCQIKVEPLCALCPKRGGAMKCTSDGCEWAHVSCAWWIEVKIGCPRTMEPIDGIWDIPPRKWNLVCSMCRVEYGACIQCAESSCSVAYHVTCAFDKGLKMDMCCDSENDNPLKLLSYCRKHSSLMDNPKSVKKLKPKKRTRRNSSDIESPRKLQPQTHEMSVTKTIMSLVNENEFSETGCTSDSNSQSSGVDSSAAQNSRMRNKRRKQESLSRTPFRRKGPPENLFSPENETGEDCTPYKNRPSSTEEKYCSPCQQDTSAKQGNHQSFNEQTFAIPQEHCSPFKTQPPVMQEESCVPSTSTVQDAYYPIFRQQSSLGSNIQKQTMESASSSKRHPKTVNYEQLTKFITVHLKSVSPQKALQLERKIINLCTTRENPKKG